MKIYLNSGHDFKNDKNGKTIPGIFIKTGYFAINSKKFKFFLKYISPMADTPKQSDPQTELILILVGGKLTLKQNL